MGQLRDLVGRRPPDVAPPPRPRRPAPRRDRLAVGAGPGRRRRAPPDPRRDPRRRHPGRRPGLRPPRRPAARRPASTSTSTCSARPSSATTRPPPASTPCATRIRRPDVTYVSVKISALCAGLDVLAFDHEVDRIADRLRAVYDVAAAQAPPVFVNLDMEEYRDLHLTVAAFRRVLDEPRVPPPAARASSCRRTCPTPTPSSTTSSAWVERAPRRRRGADQGAPRQGGQPGDGGRRRRARRVDERAVPHQGRRRRQLQGAPRPAPRRRRRRRPASSASPATTSSTWRGRWSEIRRRGLTAVAELEMLEGMAPPQARATRDEAGRLLLYTPVVTDADFAASIAYLARRLDENAGPENFLRALFTITPGSPAWDDQRGRFELAVAQRHDACRRRRAATRTATTEQRTFDPDAPFANEPDTDFTQARQPRLDRRATSTRSARRRAHRSSRRPPASTPSSSGPAPAPPAGGRRRPPSGAPRCPGSPSRWPPTAAGPSP